MSHHKLVARTDIYNPTFKLFEKEVRAGISYPKQNLTINGQTVAPTFMYDARQATLSGWTATVGEDLTAAGSGGTVGINTPFYSAPNAVSGDGARDWVAGNSAFANITTEDLVVELVLKLTPNLGKGVCGKYNFANPGWMLYRPAPEGTVSFRLVTSGVVGTNVSVTGLTSGAWYHIIIFVDRTGLGVAYANGVSGLPVTVSQHAGSMSNTEVFALNNYNAGFFSRDDSDIAYISMWKKDNWLDTHLQADIAAERFSYFVDEYPIRTSGIGHLDKDLTINGTTVEPTFRYEGRYATTSGWMPVVGETLTGAGSGGTVDLETPFISDDKAVNGDGTRYWEAGNTNFAEVTTEDIVIEMVLQAKKANKYIIRKTDTFGPVGWRVRAGASGVLYANIGNSNNINTAVLTDDAWYHIVWFLDRDGSAQAYVDGSASGAAIDISTESGSQSDGTTFSLAGVTGLVHENNIAYISMWQRDAWLDTHLQETIAKERFAKLTGIYPTKADGTALPVVASRASVAYLDKEILGDEIANPFSSGEWSPLRLTKTASGTSPSGAMAYILAEDTGTGTHSLADSALFTPNVGDVYEISMELKAINRDWVWVTVYGASELHNGHYVDLSTGAFGNDYGNVVYKKLESLGDDWYRLTYRAIFDTSEAKMPILYVAEANLGVSFAGLDQESVYIANPSVKTVERQLFPVGNNWMRVCQRTDSEGTSITGYLPEVTTTNLLLYSQDFDNAAWTKARCSISASAGSAPDGSNNASILVEDGTAATTHYYFEVYASTPGTYTFSQWFKASNRNWTVIQVSSTTDGSALAYFDLSTGEVGTATGLDDYGIEDWGDGWYRCWIKDTRATAETQVVYVYAAEADSDNVFDGLSQDSLYIWGAQVEEGVDYPTSYIYTSGSTETRNADVLYYKGDDGNVANNQQGTMVCDVLIPIESSDSRTICEITDGDAAGDRIYGFATAGGGEWRFSGAATGGSATNVNSLINISNNTKYTCRATWKTNEARTYVDNVEGGTPDSDCGIPDDLDIIRIGCNRGDAIQLNGIISNIKIYGRPTRK